MLYNFLYGAYRRLNRPHEALKLMKETLQIFPDYLFARVEYALYLLRRGEPDKAHEALGKAGTLSQLYPERKIFHAAEWKSFSYAMGLYWIKKDNINQAKVYLGIIQNISPNSGEVKELQKEIKSKLFLQAMERHQKE
jgi:tetratricopeptide (TPR) repeat protein